MAKRKSLKDNDNDVSMRDNDDSGSDSVREFTRHRSKNQFRDLQLTNCLFIEQDVELVNVEFEWFDPKPEVDFHGLKTLLRQLLDNDAQLFDMSALADLILSQPLLGSTVKVDGMETDPYAFLSVLNLSEHKVKAGRLETKYPPNTDHYLRRTNKSLETLQSILRKNQHRTHLSHPWRNYSPIPRIHLPSASY